MKRILFLLLVSLILIGCGPAATPAPPTPDVGPILTQQALSNEISTMVAGTEEAVVQLTLSAPPPTNTPRPARVFEMLLNAEELNELKDMWAVDPITKRAEYYENLCVGECVAYEWASRDLESWIRIALYSFDDYDIAYSRTRAFQFTQTGTAIDIPEIVSLPFGAWIFGWEPGSGYALHARRGKLFTVVTINLPDLDQDQNTLFLALYGERQIQKINLLDPE
jgi:hypothetical protein